MKKYTYALISLIILVATLYFYFIGANTIRSARGIEEGKEYVTKMYSEYSVAGNVCQGEDTDGDGYISCDFRIKSGNKESVVNLQCPTFIKSYLGTSCKEARLQITPSK